MMQGNQLREVEACLADFLFNCWHWQAPARTKNLPKFFVEKSCAEDFHFRLLV
jgi:hypothetical protein